MIYIDILFLTNLTFDLLSLYLTACLTRGRLSIFGMMFSGVVAAACGTWLLLGCANAVIFGIVAFFSFLLMILLSFRPSSASACIRLGFFTLLFMVIGGAFSFWLLKTATRIWGTGVSSGDARTVTFLVISLLIGFVLTFAVNRWKRAALRETAEIVVSVGEKRETVTCMVDSGHLLSDPLTGIPVLFIPDSAGRKLLPEEVYVAMRSEEISPPRTTDHEILTHVRLIPYTTESGGGLLHCYRADSVGISGVEKMAYLALRNDIGEERGLCPSSLLS